MPSRNTVYTHTKFARHLDFLHTAIGEHMHPFRPVFPKVQPRHVCHGQTYGASSRVEGMAGVLFSWFDYGGFRQSKRLVHDEYERLCHRPIV